LSSTQVKAVSASVQAVVLIADWVTANNFAQQIEPPSLNKKQPVAVHLSTTKHSCNKYFIRVFLNTKIV